MFTVRLVALSVMTGIVEHPYRSAAAAYWDAGWRGVLPLPSRAKYPPPPGWTGRGAPYPSRADLEAWAELPEFGSGNIALRLPDGVLGLDVDDYMDKAGGAWLEQLEERLGALPPTWVSTARDGRSGIRFYRVPEGLHWPGQAAPGIEVIQAAHRYAVVWPSMHPETGTQYRWINPDGCDAITFEPDHGLIPEADELPELSPAWVEYLRGLAGREPVIGVEMSGGAAQEWFGKTRGGPMCDQMRRECDTATRELAEAIVGSRHDAMTKGVRALVAFAGEGHAGGGEALVALRAEFERVVEEDRRRDVAGEWMRSLIGAVSLAAAEHPEPEESCLCELRSGEGVQFEPPAGYAEVQAVVPGEPTLEDIQRELYRLKTRFEARERFDDERHALGWRPPESHWSLTEDLAEPDDDPEWRIHNLLGYGHNAILVAGRKSGKTTMVNELIRAYVDDVPFLGTFEMVPTGRDIAVFNYEVGQNQYRRWLRQVGIKNTDQVHVLPLRGESLPLRNTRVRKWVTNWLIERNVGMWVLDPYSRAYLGSVENIADETQVGAFLDSLDVIKKDANVVELIMPAHTPKARVEPGEETAIGSQRLEAWPDVMWYLTRDIITDLRFLRAEGRDVDIPEQQLTYNKPTRQLFFGGQDRKSARSSANGQKLFEFISAHPNCSLNDIRVELGWNGAKVESTINSDPRLARSRDGEKGGWRHFIRTVDFNPWETGTPGQS